MSEVKWAELLAMLMKYASEIFSSLEGFKTGRLTVEADAEKSILKIVISKDAEEKLDIDFSLSPKSQQKEEKPSTGMIPETPLQEEPITEQPVAEEPKKEEPPEQKEQEEPLEEREEDIFDIF